ncbi:MAG: hypothetical protein APR63_04945 [Desulfuromonas sp. SDB]|nr:MAG: hypothetical protein APR63_04945 [Desulfuromonas sp. SDB]
MGFSGKHICNLDLKGRFFLPAKFRKDLEVRKVFVTKGFDKCLNLYRIEDWGIFENKLLSLPVSKSEVRNVLRYFIGSGERIEIDGKGRIKIPQELLDFVGIDKQLVALGQGNRIELWSPDALSEVEQKMYKTIEDSFDKLDI